MTETDLEVLAPTLIDLRREGMPAEDVEVLYAHHVLGFSIAELAPHRTGPPIALRAGIGAGVGSARDCGIPPLPPGT